MSNVVSLQSGLREYNGNLTQYTGMLGGLTPDIHTLKSLNPLTTNRVMVVMYRGPFFMMHYFAGKNGDAYQNREFATYKKVIEYYNMGVQCNIQDATLASSPVISTYGPFTVSERKILIEYPPFATSPP